MKAAGVVLAIALIAFVFVRIGNRPVPSALSIRHRDQLPLTDLGWVKMHDHFVQTVGARAGTGQPLGPLLVLADATFAPRSRFPLHSHQEMEIVSVVISGTLTHFEPGHSVTIAEGAAQVMSSREGITHAEGNETDTPTRMLQIWLQPNELGGAGHHEVIVPKRSARIERVTPATLRTPASVSIATLTSGESLELKSLEQRYVICTGGTVTLEDHTEALGDGDGLLLQAGQRARLSAREPVTLVIIELPAAH